MIATDANAAGNVEAGSNVMVGDWAHETNTPVGSVGVTCADTTNRNQLDETRRFFHAIINLFHRVQEDSL